MSGRICKLQIGGTPQVLDLSTTTTMFRKTQEQEEGLEGYTYYVVDLQSTSGGYMCMYMYFVQFRIYFLIF